MTPLNIAARPLPFMAVLPLPKTSHAAPKSRADVLPVRHVVDLLVGPDGTLGARSGALCASSWSLITSQPETRAECHPIDRPLVLREGADVVVERGSCWSWRQREKICTWNGRVWLNRSVCGYVVAGCTRRCRSSSRRPIFVRMGACDVR